jgi:hypothetical protein
MLKKDYQPSQRYESNTSKLSNSRLSEGKNPDYLNVERGVSIKSNLPSIGFLPSVLSNSRSPLLIRDGSPRLKAKTSFARNLGSNKGLK